MPPVTTHNQDHATGPRLADDGPALIAVHIGRKPRGNLAALWPHGDFFGAMVAREFITAKLAAAGLLWPGGHFGCRGPLDDCLILAKVTCTRAAAGLLQEQLNASVLAGFFTLAEFTATGWVCIYPNPGAPANWLADQDRQDAAYNAAIDTILRDFDHRLEQARALLPVATGTERQQLEAAIADLAGARQVAVAARRKITDEST